MGDGGAGKGGGGVGGGDDNVQIVNQWGEASRVRQEHNGSASIGPFSLVQLVIVRYNTLLKSMTATFNIR